MAESDVRLLKGILSNGAREVRGTDLLDAQTYPAPEFQAAYGWRWRHETYHDQLKNIFDVERFSGKSVLAIKQDVYGVVFLATLESILSKPVQAVLTTQGEARQCRSAGEAGGELRDCAGPCGPVVSRWPPLAGGHVGCD